MNKHLRNNIVQILLTHICIFKYTEQIVILLKYLIKKKNHYKNKLHTSTSIYPESVMIFYLVLARLEMEND